MSEIEERALEAAVFFGTSAENGIAPSAHS